MQLLLEHKTKTPVKPQYPIDVLGHPEKKWDSCYTQQGDCVIKKCGKFSTFEREFVEIPKDAEKVPGNLVLKGGTNSHALYFGDFQIYKKDSVLFIDVKTPTILDHVKDHKHQVRAEHHAQWLPVGKYFVEELLEYDHLKEESRRVVD